MTTTRNMLDVNFCPVLKDLYQKRSTVGRSGKIFDNLAALSTMHNLLTLRNLILEFRPQRTLEIGLAFGGSYLTIAASLRDIGLTAQQQHIAIDPYQHSVWDSAGLILGEKADLDGYLDFKCESSSQTLPTLIKSDIKVELIYIDGSHLFEDVFVDYYYSFQLLCDDGLLLFDDSQDEHVKKVIRFIRSNMRGFLKEINLSDYHPEGKSLKFLLAHHFKRTQLTGFQKICSGSREWNATYMDF